MDPHKKELSYRHPHYYSLQLFWLAIDKLPPGFSPERKEHYTSKFREFLENEDTPYEEIRIAITELGRESWPQRKAYEEFYVRYGRSSEEAFLLDHLDKGIRTKYEKFINDGGKLNFIEGAKSFEELSQPSPFERYFTPEEKFAIVQALLEARDHSWKEIEDLVTGARKDEYGHLIEQYRVKGDEIVKRIDELKRMAEVSDRWQDTVLDRIRVIEEGWSVMEKGVDETLLDHELDYWRGTLQAFLRV